jgi:LysR family glycine cleavage system transcriptional activator
MPPPPLKPPSGLPPLSAVRAFEAAARHESFTRAAEELGMTQAAVSYQVKALEDRVGSPLFVRQARNVALTPAGRRLAPAVTEAFEMLRTAFASAGRNVDNVLSLSILPTIASHWLVPRLGRFQIAHPQFAVQLDASHDIVDFAQGEFDLAIRSGRGDWPGLEALFLLPSHFTPVCSPRLLQASPLEGPADILKMPILSPHDPWWAEWFEKAGVGKVDLSDRLDHSFGTQTFEGMAAMAGQGVALINPFFFAADLASGRLVQMFDLILEADRSFWLVYPKARRRSEKIRAFCDWALEEARRDAAQAEECRRTTRPFGFVPS